MIIRTDDIYFETKELEMIKDYSELVFTLRNKGANCCINSYENVIDILFDYIIDNYEKDKNCYLDLRELIKDLELMFSTIKEETSKREKEVLVKATKAKHGLSFSEVDVLEGALSLG